MSVKTSNASIGVLNHIVLAEGLPFVRRGGFFMPALGPVYTNLHLDDKRTSYIGFY